MTPQERIRFARRTAGLSQSRLAQAIGVQRSAVSHWEAAQGKNPSVAHLRELAMVTGLQFEWLATGRGDRGLSLDARLDSIATAQAELVEDPLEFRLLQAFRDAPHRVRLAQLEVMEALAVQRTGRGRGSRGGQGFSGSG